MKVEKKYNQMRRDCTIDIKCENCDNEQKGAQAYDDRNFWDNVVPDFKCKKCGKSSIDLKSKKQFVATKYADYEAV